MTRLRLIASLLAREADDQRRLALDQIDEAARTSASFGSNQHRAARDAVEKRWDAEQARYHGLTDEELASLLATPPDRYVEGGQRG